MFGADGSGKTSIARRVAAYLRGRGLRVSVAWVRGSHTLASLLARMLSRASAFRGACNPYYRICIPPAMRRLWVFIEFASVLPVVLARFAAPRLLGRVVVAERCPLDFLVWLVVTLRDTSVVGSFYGRSTISLSRLLCSRILYVRAGVEALLSRRRGSGEEQLIPLELRVYDRLAEALGAPRIDTTGRSVDESFSEALEVLGLSGEQ